MHIMEIVNKSIESKPVVEDHELTQKRAFSIIWRVRLVVISHLATAVIVGMTTVTLLVKNRKREDLREVIARKGPQICTVDEWLVL